MIGTIEIRCHAAQPQMPLPPVFAFKGSPSSLRILDVPRRIGEWQITAVKVAATYPDNSIIVQDAVRTGNVWVCTFAGCDVSGKTANGIQIIADGIDENGEPVTGYVLGCGDLYILNRDSSIAADDEKWYVRYCDETPATPATGDVVIDNGAVKMYDGDEWIRLDGAEGKVDKVAFHTFDECDLSDVATQREVRETVQTMLAKLKSLATCIAAMTALCAFGIDGSTAWEDVPPTSVVQKVVAQFAPAPGDYATVSNRAMNADGNFLAVDGPFFWSAEKMITLTNGGLTLDNTGTLGGILDITYDSVSIVDNGETTSAAWADVIAAANDTSAPSAPEVTAALRWKADGTACVVSVASGGTLTADMATWTEGQCVMCTITLASGATVANNIQLLGYSPWPTDCTFAACAYRMGNTVYVVPSTTL